MNPVNRLDIGNPYSASLTPFHLGVFGNGLPVMSNDPSIRSTIVGSPVMASTGARSTFESMYVTPAERFNRSSGRAVSSNSAPLTSDFGTETNAGRLPKKGTNLMPYNYLSSYL